MGELGFWEWGVGGGEKWENVEAQGSERTNHTPVHYCLAEEVSLRTNMSILSKKSKGIRGTIGPPPVKLRTRRDKSGSHERKRGLQPKGESTVHGGTCMCRGYGRGR